MSFILFEIIFFAGLLTADLVSKHFVMPFLSEQPQLSYVVIDKVLSFTYSLNNGAGFGVLSGKTALLIGITAVAMVFILLFCVFLNLRKTHRTSGGKFLCSAVVMILAGGVGNLVDRIACSGVVRDFIEYTVVETLFNKRFAICNLADVWLTLGMIFLIIYVLFVYREKKPEPVLEPKDDPNEDSVSIALAMLGDKPKVTDESPDALGGESEQGE